MQTSSLQDLMSRLDEDSDKKLSIILNNLSSGNDQVLITPVGERVGPDVILDSWMKIFDSKRSVMNTALIEIEESQIPKYGPRSIAKPYSEIKDQILSSYSEVTTSCEHLSPLPARSSDKGKLRRLSESNALKYLKTGTNSGLPWLEKKGKTLLRDINHVENSDFNENWPCVPFIRTQELGKTRLVKGYPMSDIIEEVRYFQPLFSYYRKMPCYAAMNGPEEVNASMSRLVSESVRLGQSCLSGDIKAFDDDFKVPLQTKCFEEMEWLLQMSPEERDHYWQLAHRFGHKGLVLPDYVAEGPHGLPSGSQFTNLVGSIGNRKVCDHPLELSQFLGDDFAVVTPDPNKIFNNYESCGLALNEEKTYINDNYFIYLQNLYHADYVVNGQIKGVYPTIRALNRLVYPERFADFNAYDLDGKNYFAIRSLSILENCKYHPLFPELVKFWLKYDKYTTPTQQSLSNYAKMISQTTGSLGTKNQYGDDPRGLRSFESYKIAMQLQTS